jgi:hypothetical protein
VLAQQRLIDSKRLTLEIIVISNDAPADNVARTGNRRESRTKKPSGAALGNADR